MEGQEELAIRIIKGEGKADETDATPPADDTPTDETAPETADDNTSEDDQG